MKKKIDFRFIIIIVLLSIFLSFLLELFFNRHVLKTNNDYHAEIIEMHNIEKKGNWYITVSDEAYIILKTKDNFVNKIQFNYSSNENILWKMEYNNESFEHSSSSLIQSAVRKINKNIDNQEIKLSFYKKNLKIKDFTINNKIYINWSRMLVVCMLFFGVSIIIKYRKYFFDHLEKAFLFIALITGILMIITIPKNCYISWDDQIHIKNSYVFFDKDVSNFSSAFKAVTTISKIEDNLFTTQEERKELYTALNKLHQKTKNDQIQVNNSSEKYSRLVYIPFYIGFKIADSLNLNYISTFVIAKLFSFLFYIFLMYFAIKISTYAKKIIFLISLFVSNIFLATQFSYDSAITASLTLALAMFLRLLEMEKINKKYLFAFIGCIIWGSLPKAIYSPLLLLLLFIPNKKFDNQKQAIIFKSLIVFITVLLISTFVLPLFTGNLAGDPRGGNTNTGEQLKLILHNPLNYCKILLKCFIVNGQAFFLGEKTFICLAYLDFYISMFIPILYIINLVLLLYVLFSDSYPKEVISNKIKAVFLTAYIGISLLIATAMYLSFTVVGSNDIAGIQPRYFIPILLILLLVIVPTKEKKKKEKIKNNNLLILVIPYCTLWLINFLMVYRGIGF